MGFFPRELCRAAYEYLDDNDDDNASDTCDDDDVLGLGPAPPTTPQADDGVDAHQFWIHDSLIHHFIDPTQDQVCVPLTFRYLLHILLELLGEHATPALREASVELLQAAVATMLRLCQRSDQHRDPTEHRECLQDQLHPLLTKLLEALDQGSPAASASEEAEEEAAPPPPPPPDKRRIATLLQLLAGQKAPAWLWEHIGCVGRTVLPFPGWN